ncbi:MAG: signal peptidase I [Candidatus Eremiobacteraeota bacterium]|nr:signal peptidase I [Candidatus Eremiobacteraeota bacterium]
MTPLELFILVLIFAAARVILSLKRVKVNSGGRSTKIAREYIDPFVFAGLAALVLITFVARTFYIPSGSMEPTLQIHDVLLVNEFEYRFHAPHRGDIAVFPPAIPTTDDFIKRVIGTPGDTLRISHGIVFINGQALREPYIAQKPDYELAVRNYEIYVDGTPIDPTRGNIPPRSAWSAPDRIPKGCFFMMGDNRNDSEDSHIWGFAQSRGTFATGPRAGTAAHFTGHAALIFWPLNRMRLL